MNATKIITVIGERDAKGRLWILRTTELDDGWREMDATLVDQIIATNRYAIEGCLLLAEGTNEQTGRVD